MEKACLVKEPKCPPREPIHASAFHHRSSFTCFAALPHQQHQHTFAASSTPIAGSSKAKGRAIDVARECAAVAEAGIIFKCGGVYKNQTCMLKLYKDLLKYDTRAYVFYMHLLVYTIHIFNIL